MQHANAQAVCLNRGRPAAKAKVKALVKALASIDSRKKLTKQGRMLCEPPTVTTTSEACQLHLAGCLAPLLPLQLLSIPPPAVALPAAALLLE